MNASPASALDIARLIGYAASLADAYALELLRSEGVRAGLPPSWAAMGWRDISVLFNEQEYAPASIDRHHQVLAYACMRGLAVQHPKQPYRVRLLREE